MSSLSIAPAAPPSTLIRWAGWIATVIVVPFLLFDAGAKILALSAAVQGTTQLGFAAGTVRPIGSVLLVSLVLYVIPATGPLGAILLTGYLGGAVAANVRMGNALFGFTLFPVYIAVLVWGGLYGRDARVRALIRK